MAIGVRRRWSTTRKLGSRAIAVFALAACARPVAPSAAASSFDAEPWLQDFAQLQHHLGTAYANLEWNYAHRGLKLDQLASETRDRIRSATSDKQAFRALSAFIGAFRDPHLTLTPPSGAAWRKVHYGARFATDGHAIVVAQIDGGACEAEAGDPVQTIQGSPALQALEDNLALSRTSNHATALDWAVGKLTDSWFAPEPFLDFTVIHHGRELNCRLVPSAAASSPGLDAGTSIPWSTAGTRACAMMGVQPTAEPFGFPTDRHPELDLLDDSRNTFGAAVVHLHQGRTLGWLRLPSFSHEAYSRTCVEEWDQRRGAHAGNCDETCQDEFLTALGERFVRDAAERLQQFGRARVSAVVLDIANNGGGTDWAMDVVRAVSPVRLMCPSVAGIRHSHWQHHFETTRAELESCDVPGLAAADRALLDRERAINATRLAQTRQLCDLFGLFEGRPKTCSLILDQRSPLTCDSTPLEGTAMPNLPETCKLFAHSGRSTVQGLLAVPVFVLINRSTGSAAEGFAVVLKDNHVAMLVGEQTVGAGCGYTDNGIPLKLSHSGITVRAPDCSRYRRDGTNEVDGIKPDVVLDWTLADMTGRWASYSEKALNEAERLFPTAR